MAIESNPSGGYTIRRPAREYRVPNAHVRPNNMDTGTIAWILHKITGVFLVFYLITHIVVIGQSVRGEHAFDVALAFVQKPIFVFLDSGLTGVVTYHALNGIRCILFDYGIGIRQQKALFWLSLLGAVATFLISLWILRDLL
jgi:succinate dehydrogenase / fumarate reductase, cytochrome b subunit